MANKSDLLNRNGIWYFNRAYPQPLWPITGASPFRKSLRTTSLTEAKRSKPDAERIYWAEVDAAQAQMDLKKPRVFTELEAVGLVAKWFKEEDAERLEAVAEDTTPLMDPEWDLMELDGYDAEVRQEIAERDYDRVRGIAVRLATEAGLEFDPKSKPFKLFMLALLRGRRELYMIERERRLGNYAYTPTDPTIRRVLAEAPVAPSAKVRTIADMIKGYQADNADKWSPATLKATQAPLHVLREYFGATKDVSTITRDDGRELFELIKGIPTNMTKLKSLAGLSVVEAVAKAKEMGLGTLSPKTINESYLAFMGGAFRWGIEEGWLTLNPLGGRVVTDSVADRDKREPFTADQLNTLFRSGPWSCPEKRTEGDPLRYWGPLVALYQGMRRGEIAQLLVADNEVLEGVPVIHIRPSDEKRVKSLAGRRVLPVHPELIQMGYLLFVAEQRKAGHTQLFPNEKPTTAGHWGDLLGKWFAGHLKATNITGTKLGMHSFRHNFEDALRACDLHGTPMGAELAGRAKADKVSAGYGSGRYPISKLKPAMDGIGYPEVDLKHLYLNAPRSA